MKFVILTLLSLSFAPFSGAANNAVNEACRRLCNQGSECIQKCVGHAELFELKTDFIDAVAAFSPSVETRMKVLRTGASTDTLSLCKASGWSLDNMLICMRSYPTPELMKACKKLSPLQEEQVRCLRSGKTTAEVASCALLFTSTDQALHCLEMHVTVMETHECRRMGWNAEKRLDCLNRAESERKQESDAFLTETKRRVLDEQRTPASR